MPILINLLPTVYILSIFFRKVYILFTKKEICLNDIGLSENVKICKQTQVICLNETLLITNEKKKNQTLYLYLDAFKQGQQ